MCSEKVDMQWESEYAVNKWIHSEEADNEWNSDMMGQSQHQLNIGYQHRWQS